MKMAIRDVSEIIEISESRYTPDKMAYKHIIQQVDKLIRSRALEQNHDASFEVPAMILFKPRYNRDHLTRRIYRHYKKIGFHCVLDNYTMNISWGCRTDGRDDKEEHKEECEEDESSGQSDKNGEFEEDGSSSEEEMPEKKKIVVKSSGTSLAQRVANIS